jgi:hypothetical protein
MNTPFHNFFLEKTFFQEYIKICSKASNSSRNVKTSIFGVWGGLLTNLKVKTSVLELDKDTVEERQYEEHGEFDVLQEESENIEELKLECQYLNAPMMGAQQGRGESNSRPQPLHLHKLLNT